MATGKPPWNHFSQEVTAIFHIARASEAPKPPVWLTIHAQDFVKQCLRLYGQSMRRRPGGLFGPDA